MKLIGLSGTNGAGKDLVGEFLATEYDFLFISVTDLLRDECRARNLPVERENLRAISGEWRKEGGLGVLIDKAIALFEAKSEPFAGLVVASLRNPGEADRVHKLSGHVVWIDADTQVRYERVTKGDRGRGSEDQKTYEQFLAEQEAEMHGIPGDPTSLKMSAVKERSDIFIENSGNVLDVFKHQVVVDLQAANILV